MTSPSHRAWGFLSFPAWKNKCYFIALMEPSNSTTDWGSQSFEKRNANQMLESSQVWITEFLERGREEGEKKVIMHFCPFRRCVGGMKAEWTTEKQPELLFHGHQVLSFLTSTNLAWCQQAPQGVGCEPSHEQEQTDVLCSCCPFANSIPGSRKTQCTSYFKFQYH